MEPKFQNTFIPKRPVSTSGSKVTAAQAGRKKRSFFGMLMTLLFVLTLIAAAAVFGYTFMLESDIAESDALLQEAVESLEPDLVRELAIADAQLKLAEGMLRDHLVPSRFFTRLEEITLQDVQFTQFSYEAEPGDGPIIIMSGFAPDYETVALQSDVFARDEGVAASLFSDLSEPEGEEGETVTGVIFNVVLSLTRDLASYQN